MSLLELANQATNEELSALISPDSVSNAERVSIARIDSLSEELQSKIWELLETNMRLMAATSSIGWNPVEKKQEVFDPASRFIIVQPAEDPLDLVAFGVFRFDTEETTGDDDVLQEVVYCYEIQVTSNARMRGLGSMVLGIMERAAKEWKFEKVMLTVLSDNTSAMQFYQKKGYTIDPISPSRFAHDEDEMEEDVDYEILSKVINKDNNTAEGQ